MTTSKQISRKYKRSEEFLDSPAYPPPYPPHRASTGNELRKTVDNSQFKSEFLRVFPRDIVYFLPSSGTKVIGEIGKGSLDGVRLSQLGRAKQTNAGTAGVGGQRQGHPRTRWRQNASWAIGVRVAARGASGPKVRDLPFRGIGPRASESAGNGWQSRLDPRNGSRNRQRGKARPDSGPARLSYASQRNPTAYQSGNRHATPLGGCRGGDSRGTTVCLRLLKIASR
jgi:hypothetical protein